MENITEELEKIVAQKNIYPNEPMKKHTSFKIGGNADYFVKIESISELKAVLALAKEKNIPFQIVGNGSNLLVREGGIRGIVIQLGLKAYKIEKKEEFAHLTVESRNGISKSRKNCFGK